MSPIGTDVVQDLAGLDEDYLADFESVPSIQNLLPRHRSYYHHLTSTMKVKNIFGAKKTKDSQPSDFEIGTGRAPSVSDVAANAPPPAADTCTPKAVHEEHATAFNGANLTEELRIRSGSLSKLVQAVQNPVRRSRSKTVSESETDLTLSASNSIQEASTRPPNNRRPSWFKRTTTMKNENGTDVDGITTSESAVGNRDGLPIESKAESADSNALPPTPTQIDQVPKKSRPPNVRKKSKVSEPPRLPIDPKRPSLDNYRDPFIPEKFDFTILELFNEALASGTNLDSFCEPIELPYTNMLALPCPPHRIHKQGFWRRMAFTSFLLAGVTSLYESGMLLRAIYNLLCGNISSAPLLTLIVAGGTFVLTYILLVFWTQMEWANGKRSTAILFPKGVLLVR